MSIRNLFGLGLGDTVKYAKKINDLKEKNADLQSEALNLKKQLDIMIKVKEDLEKAMADYMATIDKQNDKIKMYEQTDMKLSNTERQIIEAARKGECIYTVIFPDGSKVYERVLKTAVSPSKVAVRNAAKRFGLAQSALTGTRTERWEL